MPRKLTLLELISIDEQEYDEHIRDQFGIETSKYPKSRVDKKTGRYKNNDIKTSLDDIVPEHSYEDNKNSTYAMDEPRSERVDDLYNVYLHLGERSQMEVLKRFSSYLNVDNKYKYSLKDFEKSWNQLTDQEKFEFGKMLNRVYADSWMGLSTY